MTRSIGGRCGASRPMRRRRSPTPRGRDRSPARAARTRCRPGTGRRSRPPGPATAASCRSRRGPVSVRSRVRSRSATALSTSGPPDERRELRRQVVGREVEGPERGKRGLAGRRPRPGTAAPARAKSLSRCSPRSRRAIPAPISPATDARGIREDDLAAVGGRRDPRRAVHLDAHVVARDDQRPRRCGCPCGPGRRRLPTRARRGPAGRRRPRGPPRRPTAKATKTASPSDPNAHAALCGGGPGRRCPVRAERLAVGRVADRRSAGASSPRCR